MKPPKSRKGAANVAADRAKEKEEAPPTSPKTVLELDTTSLNELRQYKGKFKYKVPTMGDRVDIASLKAQFLQELKGVDTEGDNIADALAYLSVTIESGEEGSPDWWRDSNQGIDLYDFQPLLALYAQARSYEATFLGGRDEPGSDEESPAVGPDDDDDSSVDDDIQDPPHGRKVLASFGKGGRRTDPDDAGDGGAPV